jgi:hypothetical protein
MVRNQIGGATMMEGDLSALFYVLVAVILLAKFFLGRCGGTCS